MGANPKGFKDGGYTGFNPRTRDGCEGEGWDGIGKATVSIHAPVMGANEAQTTKPYPYAFQSTHP